MITVEHRSHTSTAVTEPIKDAGTVDQRTVKQILHQENMSVKRIPPHTPLLYRKTGICRGVSIFLIFLFLLQNIDCGYSLEPPRRGGSNVYPLCFEQK